MIQANQKTTQQAIPGDMAIVTPVASSRFAHGNGRTMNGM